MLKVLERQDLRVIASPMRRQILEALAEPDSAVNLARRLGMSRQRIGYHMAFIPGEADNLSDGARYSSGR